MRIPLAHGLLGCMLLAGGAAHAITNGQADDGDPEVAALLEADGSTFCTGTLIAPGAVLTAAHCLDAGPPANVYFGATPPALGQIFDVASVQQHPDYDPATHAHDLGIVRLAGSPAIADAKVYGMPFTAAFVGLAIRVVGFGRTSTLDDAVPRKRTGQSRVDKYTGSSFSFRPAPSQTCFGDSGGPAFAVIGGVEQLVGVTSTGDLGCDAGATDVLVQSFDTGFVEGYIAGTAAAPAVAGGCALAGRGAGRGSPAGALALALLLALGRYRRRAAGGGDGAHERRA